MRKPFYGYWIVAVGFLCQLLWSGIGVYGFPLFYGPLEKEFGWSRGTISVAFTVFFLIQAFSGPFIGRLVDRYGARKVIPFGALIAGLGLLWLSSVQALWSYYLAYAVTGIGMTAMGPIPTTQVVSDWFSKRRGMIVGIMSTGIGIGGLIWAPIIGANLIPTLGWRATFLVLALPTWILIIPAALFVIKERAKLGLNPDGVATVKATSPTTAKPASDNWTPKTAIKTSALWLIALGFFTSSFSQVGVTQHHINYITDLGISVAAAAAALGGIGLGSAIGKFGFGWLCDRITAKYAAAISFALQLSSVIVLLSMKSQPSLAIVWLYSILMGLGVGGWVPNLSMLTSRNFGLASYGAIFGILTMIQFIGCAFGPLVAGYMFDTMHTYFWVFIIFVVLYLVSIPAILGVRRPKLRLATSP